MQIFSRVAIPLPALLTLTGFCLALGVAAFLLHLNWQYKQNSFLEQHASVVTTAYHASVDSYALATQILVAESVRQPEVIATFSRGIDGDPAARGQLHRQLARTYDDLVKHGIRQFHFHTATGHSYLRFHALDKFGDPLFDVRPSLRIANTEKRVVNGFEAGRVISGFRYVYPLFDGDRHLGSVETSVNFGTIRNTMARIAPEREYAFVLQRNSVEGVVFADTRNLYVPWTMNAEYFVEDPELKLANSPPPPTPEVRALDVALKAHPRLIEGMAAGHSFTLPVLLEGKDWAVSLVPVSDVSKQRVAYVVAYVAAPYLGALRNEFQRSLAFTALLLIGLFFLTYRLWHTQQQQRAEAERLRTITDTIADGIYVLDSHGRVILVNRAFTDLLGFGPDEILGKIGHDLFHVHNPDGMIVPLEQCPIYSKVRAGQPYHGEQIFRTRAGDNVHVEAAGRPILDNQGQPTGSSVTAFHDITARKQTEATLLEAKQAAEAANIAKSRFLATMSHELRTPMNGVLGMAQLLLAGPTSEAETKEYVRTILQSGQSLLTLLNDILDLSKVEAGKLTLEAGIVCPAEILREIQTLFVSSARSKNLTLDAHWSGPTHQCYSGDPHRLRQMISNLANNAIKFTSHGSVHITAAEVEVEHDGQSTLLEFSVSDTGMGIPADKQARLFKPFSQVDDSITRQFGGTGLGLSIVRSLARQMGGDVGVDSIEGQGTRFWFHVRLESLSESYINETRDDETHNQSQTNNNRSATVRNSALLTLNTANSANSANTANPVNTAKSGLAKLSGRVLVVEDNQTNQKVIRALLKRMGIETLTAENGLLAVERVMAEADQINAILMDVQMPTLDGRAATERIRAWEIAQQRNPLPIIALTADAFPEDRMLCLKAGMNDYLSKPVHANALASALAKWLPSTLPSAPQTTPSAPQTTPSQLNWPAFKHQAEILLSLLAEAKFTSVDRFAQLEALVAGTPPATNLATDLATELAAELATIRPDIANFHFARARAALEQLLKTHASEGNQA
jgi:two-component system, sensor histidine kinase and response regulator